MPVARSRRALPRPGIPDSSGATSRSRRSAAWHWLFTVPTVHPERLGGGGLGEILEVAQHQHGPLPRWQVAERVVQRSRSAPSPGRGPPAPGGARSAIPAVGDATRRPRRGRGSPARTRPGRRPGPRASAGRASAGRPGAGPRPGAGCRRPGRPRAAAGAGGTPRRRRSRRVRRCLVAAIRPPSGRRDRASPGRRTGRGKRLGVSVVRRAGQVALDGRRDPGDQVGGSVSTIGRQADTYRVRRGRGSGWRPGRPAGR